MWSPHTIRLEKVKEETYEQLQAKERRLMMGRSMKGQWCCFYDNVGLEEVLNTGRHEDDGEYGV